MPHDPDKLAEGIGLIAAGNSYRWVENETGIPIGTLHAAYLRHLGPNAPNKDEQRKALDERILARAGGIAEATLAHMAERLEQGQVDDRTITAWHEASAKSYGKLRGWDRGLQGDAPTDRFASVIERVLSQGGASLTVSLTPIEPASEIVTIEHKSDHVDHGD